MDYTTQKCILACEAEAVAHDLPGEVGRDIFEGILREHKEKWADITFMGWSLVFCRVHNPERSLHKNKAICDLFASIRQIMIQYGVLSTTSIK